MTSTEVEHKPEPTSAPPKEKLLSTQQLVAGALAASTSAVLGSQLGVAGTVAGAAIGSVATAVATVAYKVGMDKTRTHISRFSRLSTVRVRGIKPTAQAVAAVQPVGEPVTLHAPAAPESLYAPAAPARTVPARRRPTWVVAATASLATAAAAFAVSIGVITGYESIAGQNLSGGEGTSVGQVVRPAPGTGERLPDPKPSTVPTDRTPTPTPTTSETPATPEPTPAESTTQSQGPSPTPTQATTNSTDPAPTPTPAELPSQAPTAAPNPSQS